MGGYSSKDKDVFCKDIKNKTDFTVKAFFKSQKNQNYSLKPENDPFFNKYLDTCPNDAFEKLEYFHFSPDKTNASSGKTGGSNKKKTKKNIKTTKKRIMYDGKLHTVYINSKGDKYVKKDGKYIKLKGT